MNTFLEIGLSNAVAAGVLALAAAAVGSFCRRPAILHGLWLLVLLKLITPPLFTIPLPWPVVSEPPPVAELEAREPRTLTIEVMRLPVEDPEEPLLPAAEIVRLADLDPPPVPGAAAPALEAASAEDRPRPQVGIAWQTALVMLWLAGSAGWLLLALIRTRRFARLLRHARPAPRGLREQTERLSERLGLARCPGVWLVPGRLAPMLWAAGGPARLLLPTDLLDRLDTEQRATLLAHELAHLKRRDHWARALELLVTALYWWCPVVWWARHQLREAEEQCCDAWVVWALPGAGRTYATALVDTLDFLSGARSALPALASGIGHVHDLKRRLTMIMRGTTPRSLTWTGCLGLAVLAVLLLPVLPTWAQTESIQRAVEERLKALREAEKAEQLHKEAIELKLRLLGGGPRSNTTGTVSTWTREEELDQARAEVKQLAAHLEEMRAHMKAVEAKLRAAQDRLAHAEGRGAAGVRAAGKPGDKAEKIIIIIKDADGKVREIEVPPGGGDILKRFELELKPGLPKPPTPPVPPRPPAPFTHPQTPPPGAGSVENRLREVEKRLEMILKRLESQEPRPQPRPDGRKDGPARQEDDIRFFLRQLSQTEPLPQAGERILIIRPEGSGGAIRVPVPPLAPR